MINGSAESDWLQKFGCHESTGGYEKAVNWGKKCGNTKKVSSTVNLTCWGPNETHKSTNLICGLFSDIQKIPFKSLLVKRWGKMGCLRGSWRKKAAS